MTDELTLAERLVSYDTSRPEEIVAAAGFVKGWLESRDIEVRHHDHNGLPVLVAEVGGPSDGSGDDKETPCVVFHGHLDVVPAEPEQFYPRLEGDRLIGRGAYDMKGGLAAMMCAVKDLERQSAVRVRLICVPDEESEEIDDRSSDAVVRRGLGGDFAITGEPTNLHIGVEAKGVLAMLIEVRGRAAHSSTPWLGDNAVLKAVDVFRAIESLPFSRQSSETFDRPSINLGRIEGGDALNKVPDRCRMAVDIRFLPGQNPDDIRSQIARIPECEVTKSFVFPPVSVPRGNPYVRALRDAVARSVPDQEVLSVGRDGASDAVSFMAAGIPAVEFGPDGAGHHGPEEWVSVSSLARYRRSLVSFVRMLPMWLERPAGTEATTQDGQPGSGEEDGRGGLTAIEGGRA
ncbi:MAG TPA: M20/M25/M40 family metallo-hydrolase [Solirubrobacteraceae bacterium]|nr:M20/M25/M40 family metallo-hydrolase [Solirubrobacteraceae bacterium]